LKINLREFEKKEEKKLEVYGSIYDVDYQQWAMEAAVQVDLPYSKSMEQMGFEIEENEPYLPKKNHET